MILYKFLKMSDSQAELDVLALGVLGLWFLVAEVPLKEPIQLLEPDAEVGRSEMVVDLAFWEPAVLPKYSMF